MNIPDINPFLSTIASCSSTIVAIIGGFIASRLIEISTQRREVIIKLKEISDELKFKQERISKIEKSLLSTEAENFVLSHISDIIDQKPLDDVYEKSTKNLYTVQDFKPYWDRATDVITKFSEVQEPIILNEDGIPTSLCSSLDKFEYEVAKVTKHELDGSLPYQRFSVMDSLQKRKDEEELAQLKASNEWLLIQQKNLENKKLSLTKPKGMKSGLIIFASFSALCIIGPLLFMNSGVNANNAKLTFSILFIMGILAVFLYLLSFLNVKNFKPAKDGGRHMDEFDRASQEYFSAFGEGYPTFSVPATWTDADIVADIKQAIVEKKPREFPVDSETIQ